MKTIGHMTIGSVRWHQLTWTPLKVGINFLGCGPCRKVSAIHKPGSEFCLWRSQRASVQHETEANVSFGGVSALNPTVRIQCSSGPWRRETDQTEFRAHQIINNTSKHHCSLTLRNTHTNM